MGSLASKLFGLISTRVLWVAVIALSAMLVVVNVSNNSKQSDILRLTELAATTTVQNKRLSEQLASVKKELRERPIMAIETVREVEKEICNGKITAEQIKSIPSKRKEVDNASEAPTADIDDRLPPELIQLLK